MLRYMGLRKPKNKPWICKKMVDNFSLLFLNAPTFFEIFLIVVSSPPMMVISSFFNSHFIASKNPKLFLSRLRGQLIFIYELSIYIFIFSNLCLFVCIFLIDSESDEPICTYQASKCSFLKRK